MSLFQILVLALIQGLTEFLPVSSSAHLILGSRLFQWPDQGLVIDVAIHVGTLFAVLVYFRHDLFEMLAAWRRRGPQASLASGRRMSIYIAIASIPVIVVGAMLSGWVESHLRDVRVIAVATLVFGLLLWLADALFIDHRRLEDMRKRPALLIGLAQVLALVPGASRSGVTMTMGRMLGFSADASARFSFLLAIPVLAAAGGYGLLRMMGEGQNGDWLAFGLAVLFSSLAGWVCIAVFLSLLKRVGLLPFVMYRLALGGMLAWIAF